MQMVGKDWKVHNILQYYTSFELCVIIKLPICGDFAKDSSRHAQMNLLHIAPVISSTHYVQGMTIDYTGAPAIASELVTMSGSPNGRAMSRRDKPVISAGNRNTASL